MNGKNSEIQLNKKLEIIGEAAIDHGIHFKKVEILKNGANLVVHLCGSGVVAKSPGMTSLIRKGSLWLQKELIITNFLYQQGLPVVPPAMSDQVIEIDGLFISFWEHFTIHGPLDAERAGWGLRSIHEAMQDLDDDLLGEWSIMDEAVSVLQNDDYDLAIRKTDRQKAVRLGRLIRERLFSMSPPEPVHGDSHLGNVIQTAKGPLWIDFEDAHLAPLIWDLGCLRTSSWFSPTLKGDARIALESYGEAVNLDVAKHGRAIETVMWGSLIEANRSRDLFGWRDYVSGLIDELTNEYN